MERPKTFIVGAGASKEFGLPTGTDLVQGIESVCKIEIDSIGRVKSGDTPIIGALRELAKSSEQGWSISELATVAGKVRQNMGLAPSIDNFLDSKRQKSGWSEVGKIAIARAILRSEYKSKLWYDTSNTYNRPVFSGFGVNWLTNLFQILVTRKGVDDFCNALKACRFVVFNYDRVIEHFFSQAIKSYFDLNSTEADLICAENLNIVHVYGDLGPVTCMSPEMFGRWEDPLYIYESSKRIKTFTEGVHDSGEIAKAKSWLENSNIIFLGFGFLPFNLRVLSPPVEGKYRKMRVLGTTRGISKDNFDIAKSVILREWFENENYTLEFSEVGAAELVWNYSYFLSEADIRR